MSEHRQYNPYTKYGRRKAREQAYRNIQNYTPEEKTEYNKISCGCQVAILIAFIVVCILIGVIAGPEALLNWLR
jgi:hypothetical protein